MTSEGQEGLLILSLDGDVEEINRFLKETNQDGPAFLIDTSQEPVDEKALAGSLEFVYLDPYFQVSVKNLRDPYLEFIDGLPDVEGGGLSINDDLNFGNLSAWWVIADQFKSKTADYDHAFNRICRIDAVRRFLNAGGVDRVAVLGGTTLERELYSRLLEGEVELLTKTGRSASVTRAAASTLVRGYLRLFLELFKYVFAKTTDLINPPKPNGSGKSAVFFTRSLNWSQYDWSKDRYLHDLPESVDAETEFNRTYLMHLSNKPFADGVGAAMEEMRRVRKKRQSDNRLQFTQSHNTLRDFLSASLNHAKTCVRARRLTGSKEFRGACEIEGIDICPLVLKGTWSGLETVPQMDTLFRSVARFYDGRPDDILTTPFFESKKGRTVVAAARMAGTGDIVGLQHGPITEGKLQYFYSHMLDDTRNDGYIRSYPLPDTILVDGESAKKYLVEGGFPESRIVVTGGVRYDQLFEAVTKEKSSVTENDRDDGRPTCTVFFGLSDFEPMARIVVPGLKEHGGYRVNLKPHPSAIEETVETIKKCAEEANYQEFDIVDTDAHDLIIRSDVVISSYSSTAVETLAFEKPLIYVAPRNSIDVSPFTDADFIPKVKSIKGLVEALDRVNDTDYEDELESFLDDFFYRRDGESMDRLLGLYRSLLKGY